MISEGALEAEAPVGAAFGGVFGGLPGGVGGEVFGALGEPAPPPLAPPAPAIEVKSGPKSPLQVGGEVKPPKLIREIAPAYPALAKQAKIQGDVIISAIIDEKGEVTDMKVVAGPPLLFAAAMAAVRQWRYEPTYLNGQPWPVAHEITIHFHM